MATYVVTFNIVIFATGVVKVKSRLSAADVGAYDLLVGAADGGGLTSENTATLRIVVTPADQLPRFTMSIYKFTVPEAIAVAGGVVGNVEAIWSNSGEFGCLYALIVILLQKVIK